MSTFTDILPTKVRKIFYALITFAGVVLGSLGVAYSSIGHAPTWLIPVSAGFAYFASAFGMTAGGNVSSNVSPTSVAATTNSPNAPTENPSTVGLPVPTGHVL